MRRLNLNPIAVLAVLGLTVALGLASCSTETVVVREAPPPPTQTFSPADAEAELVEAGATFTSYCPSNKCPAGYTTCENSRFACDVNLLTDRHNCGACGAACPGATSREYYECVDGQCVMQCNRTGGQPTLDCDGLADNGCESNMRAPDSCGACGVACTDPAKPCINRSDGLDFGCGCKEPHQTFCGFSCVDTRIDNENCGKCNNPCPRGDLDPSLNMFYGCWKSECGHLKCKNHWSECDGNLDNGCETDLRLPENCGSCGTVCPEGQACKEDARDGQWRCMCAPGQTFCELAGGSGRCHDLSSDPSNCGGCGVHCRSACVNGMCQTKCGAGFADCNGSESDGCEVNIGSDPNNCGGCGITCNGIAGQACVQGRCVVEPCDEAVDAGRVPQ